MRHFQYSFVLVFVAICAIFVNLAFRLRITSQWRSFLKVDAAILVIYLSWDAWAIHKKNWRFDTHQILNKTLWGGLPVEDVLFFIIVPLMTILTYLALNKIVARLKNGGSR
jgi:lycopene cyclase domain-containing protein